jgi:hypothetical protein
MPIKKDPFEDRIEDQIREAFSQRPTPSVDFEAALFAQAEDLLSRRREQLSARELKSRHSAMARQRVFTPLRQSYSRFLDVIAMYPDRPALAAVVAVILVAFLALQGGGSSISVRRGYARLPALTQNNDFSARYEEQVRAEKQAYEREVEDAHRETSGGI